MRLKSVVLILVGVVAASAPAATRAYFVEPKTAANGWTPEDEYVGQTFVANVDSIVYIEWFVGELSAEGRYKFELILDGQSVCEGYESVPARGWQWVKCSTFTGNLRLTKGREYLLKVSHDGGDSVNFVYRTDNPYKYGRIEVGGGGWGQSEPVEFCDLVARVYGVARVGNEFSVHSNIAFHRGLGDSANWGSCIQSQAANRVRFDKLGFAMGWPHTQPTGPDTWNWEWLDYLMDRYVTHGVQPYASLTGSPGWASCVVGGPNGAIPIALFKPVAAGAEIGDSNYYARYIYDLFRRYGPVGLTSSGQQSGTYWIDNPGAPHYLPLTFAETFDECPMRGFQVDEHGNDIGWWKLASLWYEPYKDMIRQEGRKASFLTVYARLIIVADSAIKMACAQADDPALKPRTGAYLQNYGPGPYTDDEWFGGLRDRGVAAHFDAATYESHHNHKVGNPELHATHMQHFRDVYERNGLGGRPMWCSSFGPGGPDTTWKDQRAERAYQLQRAYAVVQAMNATPGPPLEGCDWFLYSDRYMPGYWGITDTCTTFVNHAEAHAYSQLSLLTQGASFEHGDPLAPEQEALHVLRYRGADGVRFWVAWSTAQGVRSASIPVLSSTVDTVSTDTNGSPGEGEMSPALDGWLEVELSGIPLIVKERQLEARPDLVVDSVRVWPVAPQVGGPLQVIYSVRNHGTGGIPQSWAVGFYWNDSLLNPAHSWPTWPDTALDQGQNVSYHWTIQSVPPSMQGHGLLLVTANPDQAFVELSTDDNSAYRRLHILPDPSSPIEP